MDDKLQVVIMLAYSLAVSQVPYGELAMENPQHQKHESVRVGKTTQRIFAGNQRSGSQCCLQFGAVRTFNGAHFRTHCERNSWKAKLVCVCPARVLAVVVRRWGRVQSAKAFGGLALFNAEIPSTLSV